MPLSIPIGSLNFDNLFGKPGKWTCEKCGTETEQPRHISLAAKDGQYRCNCKGALKKKQ